MADAAARAWLLDSLGDFRAEVIRSTDEDGSSRRQTVQPDSTGVIAWFNTLQEQDAIPSTSTIRQAAEDPSAKGTWVNVKGQWVDKYTGLPMPGSAIQGPVIVNLPTVRTTPSSPTTTTQSTSGQSRAISKHILEAQQQSSSTIKKAHYAKRSAVKNATGLATINSSALQSLEAQRIPPMQTRENVYTTKAELAELCPEDMSSDNFDDLLGQLFHANRRTWLNEHDQWLSVFGSIGNVVREDMLEIARLSEDHPAVEQYSHEFACIPDMSQHLKAARLAVEFKGDFSLDEYFRDRSNYIALYRLAQRQFADKLLATNKNLQRIYGGGFSVVRPERDTATGTVTAQNSDTVPGSGIVGGQDQTQANGEQDKRCDDKGRLDNPVILALVEKHAKSILSRTGMMVPGFVSKGGIFYRST